MALDPSIPFRAGTANQFSLADLYKQQDDQKAREQEQVYRQQQMAMQQQRMQSEQDALTRKGTAAKSLSQLIRERGAGGEWNTQSPAFQSYVENDPDGALGMLKTMDADKRTAVKEGVKDLAAAVRWADSPEKWAVVQRHYGQHDPQLAATPFEAREQALISLGQMGEYLEQTQPEAAKPMLVGPGSYVFDPKSRQPIFQAPFAPRPVTVGEGDTVYEYAPSGGGGAPAPSGGPLSVETLRPHFVAQESSGDYTAVNSETGALGAYQVMPQTGQNLARQLGVPWRPDLMRKSTDEARAYQDKIGGAAIQEAIEGGGGDPAATFSYYYGGSDRSKWGPRTRQYTSEMMGRLGGGDGNGARVIAKGPPKPEKPRYRQLTPQEVQEKGLPPGSYQESPDGEVKPIGGKNAGAGGMTRQQVGAAKAKLNGLRAIKGQIARVVAATEKLEKGGFAGPLWGNIPGTGSLDNESAAYDKAIAGLSSLVRQLTRTPGEGAMSDYESRLGQAILPKRTDNKAARDEAMATIQELVANVSAGYEDLLSSSTAAPANQPTVSNW